jgi:hypothetical protein
MTHARYRSLVDKLLFEELKMDSGQWTVNVSTAWIYLKYIAEGDTTTVNCQLSTVNFQLSTFNFPLRSFK